MTDPSQPGPQQAPLTGADPNQQGGPQLRALSQFVKDLSFENPGNPMAQGQPNIDIGIDVQATPHRQGNGVYEVSLKLRAVAQIVVGQGDREHRLAHGHEARQQARIVAAFG